LDDGEHEAVAKFGHCGIMSYTTAQSCGVIKDSSRFLPLKYEGDDASA
jgi:hypothetical protein